MRGRLSPVRELRHELTKVRDVMHQPTFVPPETTVADAAKIMMRNNISSVIVGKAEEPVGMFTERDMLKEVIMEGIDTSKVSLYEIMCGTELKNVMCKVITTVNKNEPIERAAEKMMGRYVRHLPVVDDNGVIVGMISARNVMDALKGREAMAVLLPAMLFTLVIGLLLGLLTSAFM